MTQYIDKSALVAEIEKRIQEVNSIPKKSYEIGLVDAYKITLSFLDTLEVKEVEKEISFQWSKFCLNGKDRDSFVKVAKHFFELGLRTQKGEEV